MFFDGAIGIDLGTTYSCVAVFRNNTVEVIPNDQGNRTTPSCVAFYKGEVLVGDAAKNLMSRGVSGVVYDAKRMIGRRFSDKTIRENARLWPFALDTTPDDRLLICVEHNGETLRLEPEQIAARVLTYLKEVAESYLGKQVKKAVVTVPAYFNDSQRQATKDAGTIAGLEVLRIINEPTAAAIAYGLGTDCGTGAQGNNRYLNILVFDFGGGTFDVSIITIDGGCFAVRATHGDTHLGGQDVDKELLQHVLCDLKSRHGVDATSQPRILARLRARCEQAKRVLSHATTEEIVLDGLLPDGEEYVFSLTRAKLEELCSKIFSRCMDVVRKAMKDAAMTVEEIDEVILVGGSSRIPALRTQLQEMFKGKQLCCSVHPDEAVAMGAAVQANIIGTSLEQQSESTAALVLMDVVSLSIGVEVDDGKFDVIIPRNTTIPYVATKIYSTVEDNQAEVEVQVFEGERPLTRHNHKLGAFVLDGITPAAKGEPTITVTFSVNADGILVVTATEDVANVSKTLVVENSDRLSEEAVRQMIEMAKRLSAKDTMVLTIMNTQQRLTQAFEELETAIANIPLPASEKLQRRIAFISHGKHWLEQQLPNYTEAHSVEKKEAKIMKLVKKAQKMLKNVYKNTSEDGDDSEKDDEVEEEEERGRESVQHENEAGKKRLRNVPKNNEG